MVIQQQKLSNFLISKQLDIALHLPLLIKKLVYLTLEDAILTLGNLSMDQLLGYKVSLKKSSNKMSFKLILKAGIRNYGKNGSIVLTSVLAQLIGQCLRWGRHINCDLSIVEKLYFPE